MRVLVGDKKRDLKAWTTPDEWGKKENPTVAWRARKRGSQMGKREKEAEEEADRIRGIVRGEEIGGALTKPRRAPLVPREG